VWRDDAAAGARCGLPATVTSPVPAAQQDDHRGHEHAADEEVSMSTPAARLSASTSV
jgi:hypothetical protein